MSREYPSYLRTPRVHADKGGHGLVHSTYVPNPADRLDERASPLLRPSLAGLARALIIAAEFDPLVDDNEAYALRLQEAAFQPDSNSSPECIIRFLRSVPTLMMRQERKI